MMASVLIHHQAKNQLKFKLLLALKELKLLFRKMNLQPLQKKRLRVVRQIVLEVLFTKTFLLLVLLSKNKVYHLCFKTFLEKMLLTSQ
jgi:hypothetical protein